MRRLKKNKGHFEKFIKRTFVMPKSVFGRDSDQHITQDVKLFYIQIFNIDKHNPKKIKVGLSVVGPCVAVKSSTW